ncbi:hypothetical protein LTR86_001396 [Recurvomyces mirabilis]|nr:hypothetical protein LTR86_001396 [Recurvomyces mirabilis]
MAPSYDLCKRAGDNALLQGVSNLLKSQKFVDLVVTLGDRSWSLHKAVLCARSQFFAKALEGDFKVAQSSSIELHDDDPDIIDKMFYYIYHGEYNDVEIATTPMLVNVRMVAAAEKYFVDHLPGIAASKLDYYTERDGGWATVDFADAIEEAYTTTADQGRQLRETLLEVVLRHKSDLFDNKKPEFSYFQAMAARTPGFAADVASALCRAPITPLYRCPSSDCSVVFRCEFGEADLLDWECPECGVAREDWKPIDWDDFMSTELDQVPQPSTDD